MATLARNGNLDVGQDHPPITKFTVGGFKSIREEQSIDLAPLTILAGANSSGKSSMMQAVLLLKQTLESQINSGPILLPGLHFWFDNARELLSCIAPQGAVNQFHVGVHLQSGFSVTGCYEHREELGLCTTEIVVNRGVGEYTIGLDMPDKEIRRQLPQGLRDSIEKLALADSVDGKVTWTVRPDRCFLQPQVEFRHKGGLHGTTQRPLESVSAVRDSVLRLIHLPGIRRNPADSYRRTVDDMYYYRGTFDHYVASLLHRWQTPDSPVLASVQNDLQTLELTAEVYVDQISDVALNISVGRLTKPHSKSASDDLVPIAQTGLGTSHALPVVVALHAATANNLVYLEQPELHLHPRAQVAMAEVLARAVKRGVRMVIETHSSLLLLAIQALVAEGKLPPDSVILHWFTRSKKDGATTITTGNLDKAGAYGEWPEDFGDVESKLDCRYLDAAEAQMIKR